MTKTDVDTVKNTAVGSYDYGDMAHEGFEGTSVKDLSIPFINVLQQLSPEVADQTIPGAKAGDLLNSVTREIINQPLIVIPLEKEESFVEWIPRTRGGGLVGRHLPNSEQVLSVIQKNGGSRIPPKDAEGKRIAFKSIAGNDLIETHYVYCLIMDETGSSIEGYCVLSFSSAKIKAYKDWMTSLYTLKGAPPIYASRAKISTRKEKNDSGTFFIYQIAPLNDTWRESLIPPDEAGLKILTEARDFRKMIAEGLAKPDFDGMAKSGSDADVSGRSSGGGSSSAQDEDLPF
jgi:hypothetical protein